MNHQEKWIEEHRLNRHPILQAIHDACQAVEACGASVELTNAVTKVGDLHNMVVELLNQRDEAWAREPALSELGDPTDAQIAAVLAHEEAK